jgi:carbonic anhydrase
MKKLVQGIINFQKNMRPGYQEIFAKLALGQSPDTLFIACSDSRMAVNAFASTEPGDMFVVRNVGNMVPMCGFNGLSSADESEGAAIEFAMTQLNVADIIVCGHSECGAMHALLKGREKVQTPNLKEWLRHGEDALLALEADKEFAAKHLEHNRLSQLNVLQQIENLKSYPIVQERITSGKLRVHGWWFEIAAAKVHYYDPHIDEFIEIDEAKLDHILESIEGSPIHKHKKKGKK